METDYNFWRDLQDTYQSLPDWLKLLWLVIPSGMLMIAGNGLARLIQRMIAPSPPPPPPPYRGRLDAYGGVYLEPVTEAEQEALADMRDLGNRAGFDLRLLAPLQILGPASFSPTFAEFPSQ